MRLSCLFDDFFFYIVPQIVRDINAREIYLVEIHLHYKLDFDKCFQPVEAKFKKQESQLLPIYIYIYMPPMFKFSKIIIFFP